MADGGGSALVVVLLVFLLLAVVGLVVVTIVALPQLQAAVNSAVSFVQTGIVRIEGLAISVFNELEFLLSNAFAFVTSIANDVATVITTGINTAIESVVALGNSVLSTLVSVFNDVRAVILTIVDGVLSVFSTTIEPVLDVVKTIWNTVSVLTSQVVCFISNLVCCTLGGGCKPPPALNCCACNAPTCEAPKVCENGVCVDP